MDVVTLVVSLSILVLCAGAAFFGYMYVKKLGETDENVKNNSNAITNERKDRMGNFKTLVDEVNRANKKITTGLNSKIGKNTDTLTSLGDRIDSTNGIFTLSASSGDEEPVNIFDKPGHSLPNLNIMKRLIATSGVTVEDVNADGAQVKICGNVADASKCIEFPNADGDTVLRGIGSSGKLRVNGVLNVDDGIVTNSITVTNGGGILSDGDIQIQGKGGSRGSILVGDKKLRTVFDEGMTFETSILDVEGTLKASRVIIPTGSAYETGQEGQMIVGPTGIKVFHNSEWREIPYTTIQQ